MLNILRKCWPSPAMIVATVAVILATAGVASSAPFSTGGDNAADKQLFHQMIHNAAPNLSVKYATTAGSANSATTANTANSANTATTATNAQMLAGKPASAYTPGNCQVGTIKGSLVITASTLSGVQQNTPSTVGGFNCTGGDVEIRRTGQGDFFVFFSGLTDGPASIASGSCVISALVANTGGEPVSLTCEKMSDSGVFGNYAFFVQTLEKGSPADVGFSLLAF